VGRIGLLKPLPRIRHNPCPFGLKADDPAANATVKATRVETAKGGKVLLTPWMR